MAFNFVLFSVISGFLVTDTVAQTGLCPAPNGDFPNPSSELCTTFFRCIRGIPSLLRCPADQRFHFLFRFCRPQESVDCRSQLQVFTAPSLLSGIGGINSGLFPLAENTGVGGLGDGGALGVGLPQTGLINLINQLGGSENYEENGNNQLATLLMMSALINQMNSGNQETAPVNPALIPVTKLFPADRQAALTLPAGQSGQITHENYQQSENLYRGQDAQVNPNMDLFLGNGKTFIFIPQQLAPSADQSILLQGQRPLAQDQSSQPQGQAPMSQGQKPLHQDQSSLRQDQTPLSLDQPFLLHGQPHLPQGQPPMSQGQSHLHLGQSDAVSAGTATDVGDFNQIGVLPGAPQSPDSTTNSGLWSDQSNFQVQSGLRGQFVHGSDNNLPGRRFPRRRRPGQRRYKLGPAASDLPLQTTDSTDGGVGVAGRVDATGGVDGVGAVGGRSAVGGVGTAGRIDAIGGVSAAGNS